MNGSAAVVGSGPNGLAAAIRLAQAGLQVDVYEAASQPGGGASTAELTLPGFLHDRGSAIHPMGVSSPFFSSLPLAQHGLKWILPPTQLAHPLDDGSAVTLDRSLNETARGLGPDAHAWQHLTAPYAQQWQPFLRDILRPLTSIPRHPFLLARFGLHALAPASLLAEQLFESERARALFAGLAAHSFVRLEQPLSAAFGIVLAASAHASGWPQASGGSQAITNALLGVLRAKGGTLHTGARITSLEQLGKRDVICCDVTPRQFASMAGAALPYLFHRTLARYRYGPGIFKIDYALSEPVPWKAAECRRAGTVHLGGTLAEIAASERAIFSDQPVARPFIILAQPTLFDETRAPEGKHIVWAYCHVPNGWRGSHLQAIEAQIERFAPGFRECVLARHTAGPADMEQWNSNLVGGDINGGLLNMQQFVWRPTLRQYRTPLPGVYLCSASTPPGGGVHGMCGFNAANSAIGWLARSRRLGTRNQSF